MSKYKKAELFVTHMWKTLMANDQQATVSVRSGVVFVEFDDGSWLDFSTPLVHRNREDR